MADENATITFRLKKSLVDYLKKEANTKHASVNALVSNIFLDHIELHTVAPKLGLRYFPKSILQKIGEKCTKEQISVIAENYVQNELKSQVWMLGKKFESRELIDFIELWVKINCFAYEHKDDEQSCMIAIHHELGCNFSFLLQEIFRISFKELKMNVRYMDMTDNTITFHVDVKP